MAHHAVDAPLSSLLGGTFVTIIMTMVAVRKTIAAGEFKARCLELMDRVAESGEPLIITKRGKPVAVLTPVRDPSKAAAGFFKGRMEIVGDIVAPVDVDWGPAEAVIRRRKK
jgi:prevent-host-death family protein